MRACQSRKALRIGPVVVGVGADTLFSINLILATCIYLHISALEPTLATPESIVAVSLSPRPGYVLLDHPIPAPELAAGRVRTTAAAALRELLVAWGLDGGAFGSTHWNPLGALIPPGSRVLIKPNWVIHTHKAGLGLECLVTHPDLIEAVLDYVALTRPGVVTLGDAPVQGCDFDSLMTATALRKVVARLQARGLDLSIADFRLTLRHGDGPGAAVPESKRRFDEYVLFDLGNNSLLEPLSANAERFRVTMYDPALLNKTHALGKHQYLIAKEAIDADVVINLPKLKAHKKACITGALKNLVGINGHKEYLPHHRKGGERSGGDCYAGNSRLKGWAEELLDIANSSRTRRFQKLLGWASALLVRVAHRLGDDMNMEGSWFGNDTVWRMTLDLQRVLRYGRIDGSMDDRPQRTVISITDAIIGGEGEGPMLPRPVPSGFLTGSLNPAAAEWVNARLMGWDPTRIPLTREAFSNYRYPIARFQPADIQVSGAALPASADEILPFADRAFDPPEGWRGHCELAPGK